MKTEKEYLQLADELLQLSFTSDTAMADAVAVLKQHLADACTEGYEKGIRDAAEAACDSQKYYTRDASVQCLQIHDRILTLLTKPKDKE